MAALHHHAAVVHESGEQGERRGAVEDVVRIASRHVLVRGRRAPIVGVVSMDMTMIDVTGLDVSTGDEVVIVGEQGGEAIGMREVAASIGTIPYELLCRVGSRIERVYS